MTDRNTGDNPDAPEERTTVDLEEKIELLSEKSGLTREYALEHITKEMRANFLEEFLADRRVTLLEAAKRGLKKGSVKERQQSALCISLLSITLGADNGEVYRDASPVFDEVISNNSLNDEARAAAFSALAMVAFISNNDEFATHKNLEQCSAIFSDSRSSAALLVATLKAWSLLATTVSASYLHDDVIPVVLTRFVSLLQHDSVDVRLAAGEGIALIFEIARESEPDFDLHRFGEFTHVDIDNLLDALNELSSDKSRQRAKKDKAKQKTGFREITSSVEEGYYPSETLSFKHQKVEFDSWVKLTRLNALRDVLGEGLQVHFENNSVLQDIFGVRIDKSVKKTQLSAVEKRMLKSQSSPLSKERTRNLKQQRAIKGSRFAHEDDEVSEETASSLPAAAEEN